MKETSKRPGTHQAMLARQRERLALRLNRPVRGIRGLKNLAAELERRWGGSRPPPKQLTLGVP